MIYLTNILLLLQSKQSERFATHKGANNKNAPKSCLFIFILSNHIYSRLICNDEIFVNDEIFEVLTKYSSVAEIFVGRLNFRHPDQFFVIGIDEFGQ